MSESERTPKHGKESQSQSQNQTNQNQSSGTQANQQQGQNQTHIQGDGANIHNTSADNTKGLEYLYKLLETQNLTIQQKDSLIQELQEKRIKDASLVAEIKAKIKEYEQAQAQVQSKGSTRKQGKGKSKSKKLATATVVVAVVGVGVGTSLFVLDSVRGNKKKGVSKSQVSELKKDQDFTEAENGKDSLLKKPKEGAKSRIVEQKKAINSHGTGIETLQKKTKKVTQAYQRKPVASTNIDSNPYSKAAATKKMEAAKEQASKERFVVNGMLEGVTKSSSKLKVIIPKINTNFHNEITFKLESKTKDSLVKIEVVDNKMSLVAELSAKNQENILIKYGSKLLKSGLYYFRVYGDTKLLATGKFTLGKK